MYSLLFPTSEEDGFTWQQSCFPGRIKHKLNSNFWNIRENAWPLMDCFENFYG